jgi:hypothetical protein
MTPRHRSAREVDGCRTALIPRPAGQRGGTFTRDGRFSDWGTQTPGTWVTGRYPLPSIQLIGHPQINAGSGSRTDSAAAAEGFQPDLRNLDDMLLRKRRCVLEARTSLHVVNRKRRSPSAAVLRRDDRVTDRNGEGATPRHRYPRCHYRPCGQWRGSMDSAREGRTRLTIRFPAPTGSPPVRRTGSMPHPSHSRGRSPWVRLNRESLC